MKKAAATSYFAAMLGGVMLIAAAPTLLGDHTTSAAEPSAFPQPPVRRSSGSVLRTTLHARIGENELVDQISGEIKVFRTPTFEGRILGPTLEVRPGGTLAIDLVNELPPNPVEQRRGAFPHDPFTINLHTHGLSVSPLGISDNVFRQMEPGTRNPVRVDIPHDHPSGTYWYHPHKHGSATFQMIGGMAGFLIVKGGPGTLDQLPEIKAAKDLVMGFQVIRAGVNGDLPFVNQEATQFGTFPFGTTDPLQQGVFSTYGLDGAPGRSYFDFTTNGATNPTLRMRPGEVQRWRMLNAADAESLLVALQGHGLNIVAMDGITVGDMYSLRPGTPVVMSPGQRYDVLVKADKPGTYLLQALDPATPVSVSPSGIDPTPRITRHSFDFPDPCSIRDPCDPATQPKQVSYPVSLATVVVDGDPVDMALPTGPLPVPKSLPSVDTMLNRTPDAVRNVAFEICGQGGQGMGRPENRPPSCGWYFAKYEEKFWGGLPLRNLLLMRDDDDKGVPSEPFDPNMPRVSFEKEGLFTAERPLFNNMIAGNYEEWTVVNRSFSDHPFHIHQNPFLLTHINGKALPTPEWHDTVNVPASFPQPGPDAPQANINTNPISSITFRTYFDPNTAGCFVTHCHILSHEDVGMMQRLDILPGPNQPSVCMPEAMSHGGLGAPPHRH